MTCFTPVDNTHAGLLSVMFFFSNEHLKMVFQLIVNIKSTYALVAFILFIIVLYFGCYPNWNLPVSVVVNLGMNWFSMPIMRTICTRIETALSICKLLNIQSYVFSCRSKLDLVPKCFSHSQHKYFFLVLLEINFTFVLE